MEKYRGLCMSYLVYVLRNKGGVYLEMENESVDRGVVFTKRLKRRWVGG